MSKLLVDEISDADNTGPVTVTDGLTVQGAFTSLGIDDNATSTAMTIDSSGNVLVGKTSAGAASVGFEARANGFNAFTRDGGQPLEVRRLTSDGVLIDLRKDGTTVGSIGTANGYMELGSSDTGIRFYTPSDAVIPANPSTNSARDAAIDLGISSQRFKDLYLSGGVYLGGTGSANHLDDYEEGTFNQGSIGGITATTAEVQNTRYVKIGNIVNVSGNIYINGKTGGSGNISIAFPFAPSNNTYAVGVMLTVTGTVLSSSYHILAPYGGTTNAYFYTATGGVAGTTDFSDGYLYFNGVYRTT
jgi:hypothetical protein